jgi:alcohol dehydrogenase class IV
MADIAPLRFGPIAEGLGVKFSEANARAAALECADRVAAFIAQFDVPHSLKAAGVPEGDLGIIAEPVWNEVEHSKVVDRPVNREEIVSLLHSAYN